eukprot:TRINITY_DN15765_c0_g1_i1.p1 TRINITY_DN15765_c0_g1~~TRINITY_DN15765_c0_g1_i1.p1  ORF type:complete len:598 (+),score=118.88 TRINITY_DN15765_c0_g1_i1:250-1794(+)
MNKTVPAYPGTGQCVHKDPCPAGLKECGLHCHELYNSNGEMQTCLRSPEGTATPKYSSQMCVAINSATGDQLGGFLGWICNPQNSQVNCKMINSGGGSRFATPGFRPAAAQSDDGTYNSASWALHQNYIMTGNCLTPYGTLVDVPKGSPTPPPGPTPTPSPTPPLPPSSSNSSLFGTADCSVGTVLKDEVTCVKSYSEFVGGKQSVSTVSVGWDDPSKLSNVFSTEITPLYDTLQTVPLITWMPYPYKTWTNPSPNNDIANGQYDDYLNAFYSLLSKFVQTRRVYIRFAPEANGDFFPWSPQCPACGSTGQKINQSTKSYIDMWKYVRAKANTYKGLDDPTKVQWIWSVNNVDSQTSSAAAVFPGVSQVDWVSVDGLNFGNTLPGHTWQDAKSVYGPMLATVKSLAASKPVAVTTIGSTSAPNGVDAKNAWYQDAFPYLVSEHISMMLIYNVDSSTDFASLGGKNGASQVTIDNQSLNAYTDISTFAKTTGVFVTVNASSPLLLTDKQFQTGSS